MKKYEISLANGKTLKFKAEIVSAGADWTTYTDEDGAVHRVKSDQVVSITELPEEEPKVTKSTKPDPEEGSDPAVALSLVDRLKQAEMAEQGVENVTGRTDGPNPEPVVKSRDEALSKGGEKNAAMSGGKTRK